LLHSEHSLSWPLSAFVEVLDPGGRVPGYVFAINGKLEHALQAFELSVDRCSLDGLMEHLVRKLTHPRNIYDELTGPDRDKMFFFAMRILAHFKKGKILRREDLKALIRGTWLRQNSVDEILRLLKRRGLLRGRLDGQKWKAGRNLYKHVKP
jgi:hypothetical protein